MKIMTRIKFYKKNLIALHKYFTNHNTDDAKRNLVAADLIRNTHSIEKGLSIQNPRLGFGHKKQREMFEQLAMLSGSKSRYHHEACSMALGALDAYVNYHRAAGYNDDFINEIEGVLQQYNSFTGYEDKGGTLLLEKKNLNFDIPEIEKLFKTRHSIRDFDDTDIDLVKLQNALELAKHCPSACNRQGVRAYIIDPKKNSDIVSQLSGIGGFAEAVKKFIIITGKTSVYRIDENNQYIVSSSMYAAYLTLTLHLYGMGACVIQRPVIWTKEWEKNRTNMGIAQDEQIVCMIAVGNLKDSCVVPCSYRIENEELIHYL